MVVLTKSSERTGGQTGGDGWTDRRMGGLTDWLSDGWANGQMGGWMDGCTDVAADLLIKPLSSTLSSINSIVRVTMWSMKARVRNWEIGIYKHRRAESSCWMDGIALFSIVLRDPARLFTFSILVCSSVPVQACHCCSILLPVCLKLTKG